MNEIVFVLRNHGSDRNHRLRILFGVRIGLVVFITAEDWLQLAEILHRSAIAVDTRLSRWPLHVCAVLDFFVWNGSCLLVREFTTDKENYQKKRNKLNVFQQEFFVFFLTYDDCSDNEKAFQELFSLVFSFLFITKFSYHRSERVFLLRGSLSSNFMWAMRKMPAKRT